MISLRQNKNLKKFLCLYLPLIIASIWTLFPLYWTVITSLKTSSQIVSKPITYFPSPVVLEHYAKAWNVGGFSRYFLNSLFVSLVSTLFTVVFATMDGYAMARYKFKGKYLFLILLLCTQFVPTAMLIIPLFVIYNKLSMINTPWSLIITYITFHIPFNATLMSTFIKGIPDSLEEAAMVDGCSRKQAFAHVLLPVLLPGVAAISAYSFISSWNEYLYALMFTTSSRNYTLPVGLSMMIGEYSINYGQLTAGSVIALCPVVLMFMYVQKFMVSGLSAGAVKG